MRFALSKPEAGWSSFDVYDDAGINIISLPLSYIDDVVSMFLDMFIQYKVDGRVDYREFDTEGASWILYMMPTGLIIVDEQTSIERNNLSFTSESEGVFDAKSVSLFCDIQDFIKQIANCINNDIDAWKIFSCFECSEYDAWLKNTIFCNYTSY